MTQHETKFVTVRTDSRSLNRVETHPVMLYVDGPRGGTKSCEALTIEQAETLAQGLLTAVAELKEADLPPVSDGDLPDYVELHEENGLWSWFEMNGFKIEAEGRNFRSKDAAIRDALCNVEAE